MNVRRIARLFFVAVALAFASPSASRAQFDVARYAQVLIAGLDFDPARAALQGADSEDPAIAIERARLALYELDCDGAATILARPELQAAEAAGSLGDIARGCQRVTAALVTDRDAARAIEVHWQDEHDRALAPLMFDTIARARDQLTRDLGVDWPRPTRVVVVRDLLSLSVMTGLPYKSAQTTGTVAVAKWGRVTLLSPRASQHGFAWRDTLAHELTHLAVTRASRDRAPLWLQEGVAKREEVRWRLPGPFDDRPPADAIVRRGGELGLILPFDKLGPSIAMLPSADAATVAFAEVTSFVRFYSQTQGSGALAELLAELRIGKEPDAALLESSGADLHGWDRKWRAYIASLPREPLPALFGLGADRNDMSRWVDLRDRSRLAELLLARGHASEALTELDGVAPSPVRSGPDLGDPSERWMRARALEAAGRREEGAPLVADPQSVATSYGPWWAVRGRWARLRGDSSTADESFSEAVAVDPFDLEAACESADPAVDPVPVEKTPMCDAARVGASESSWQED